MQAQAGFSRRVVVVERTVDRNTVVLERGVVRVLTANVCGIEIPAHAALRRLDAGNRRHGRIGVVEVTAAAECLSGSCLRGGDVIQVGSDAGLDQRRTRGRRNARDRHERPRHPVGDLLRLVGKDHDARVRVRLVTRLGEADSVGVGAKREDRKTTSRVRRCGPVPGGSDCLHLHTGNRDSLRVGNRARDVTGGACQCPCSLAEERHK